MRHASLFDVLAAGDSRLTDASRVALIEHAVQCVAEQNNPKIECARLSLLHRWDGLLGPTQREHVSPHCEEVAAAALLIAKAMRLSPRQVERVRLAALLHDIGKCLIPEKILASNQPLTERQWTIMTTHAELGAHVAARLHADEDIVVAIRHHHTRYDAAHADDAPIMARIICVADALVTMTSTRSYRLALKDDAALVELRACARTQFDPQVVACAPAALMRRSLTRARQAA